MKSTFTVLLLFFISLLTAQELIDFEDFVIPADSFLNGSETTGGFSNDLLFLPNDYNVEFNSWTGWSLSSKMDTLTAGFTNSFSAITGSGVEGSNNYAVSFSSGENRLRLQGAAAGAQMDGVYLTNNTYAYLSMRDGDAFSKKFGGVTGDDPDFFLLTIKAYAEGELSADSLNFYLADYRFSDNSQDYIVKDWTFVDLSALGSVDSLAFTLTSSDVGQFGMNTPAFFCMDNLEIGQVVSNTNAQPEIPEFSLFPNPTSDYLQLDYDLKQVVQCTIMDMQGRPLRQQLMDQPSERIAVNDLPAGTYLLRLKAGNISTARIFIKR